MADELNSRIQRLIANLQESRKALDDNSKEAIKLDKNLEKLISGLSATNLSTGVEKTLLEYKKLLDAMDQGYIKTLRLNNAFINTSQLIKYGRETPIQVSEIKALPAGKPRLLLPAPGESSWPAEPTGKTNEEYQVRLQQRLNQLRQEGVIILQAATAETQKEAAAIERELVWQQRLKELDAQNILVTPAPTQNSFAESLEAQQRATQERLVIEKKITEEAKKQADYADGIRADAEDRSTPNPYGGLTPEETTAQKNRRENNTKRWEALDKLFAPETATRIREVVSAYKVGAADLDKIVQNAATGDTRLEFNKIDQLTGSVAKLRATINASGDISIKNILTEDAQKIEDNTKRWNNLNKTMGEYRAEKTKAAAQKIDPNFGPETLDRVTRVGDSGIFRSTFKYYEEGTGVLNRLDLVTDKFGNTLVDTQKRFRSFAGEVTRNMGEFLKWSIAVGLVYTPLQKLGELTKTMIDNEAKLADITVVLGNSTKTMRELFDAAAKVAQETGETLNGTLEAYAQAYKAAGGASTATERFNNANQLLSDSLILSKVSTLNEAEAIDTLSAALRQTGLQLDQGSKLLDKWVAVSKVANVDVGSLATGFAIVGDAAEAAGVDTDKLNAILGVLAESGIAGTKELGNQAKAIISGFQSDQAQKALNNLGIATKTAAGEMRNFFDVLQDVQRLRQQGLINDTQLSALTLAWGGGTRRQAVVQTIIESTKLSDIEATSAMAETGTAAEAMGKKLDTVQTSLTRLNNSFQELAQSLGDEGGLLDAFKLILDVVTGVVDGLGELMQIMGRSGPMLIGILSAAAIMNSKGPMFKASLVSRIAGGVGSAAGYLAQEFTSAGRTPTTTSFAMGRRVDEGTTNWLAGSTPIGGKQFSNMGSIASLGLITAGAIGSAIDKDYGKMGAQIAGGFIGLAISGGNPIGAAIGMSIGETFINALESSKPKFENLFTLKVAGEAPKTEEDIAKAQKEAIAALLDITPVNRSQGSMLEPMILEKELATSTTAFKEAVDIINKAYGSTKLTYTPGQVAKEGTLSREDYALLRTSKAAQTDPILQAKLDQVIAQIQLATGITPEQQTQTQIADDAKKAKDTIWKELLQGLVSQSKDNLRSQLSSGEVTNAQYRNQSTRLGGADVLLAQWEMALGGLGSLPGDAADDFEKLMEVLRNAPDETVTYMTTLATEVETARIAMGKLTPGTKEYAEAAKKVGEALAMADAYLIQTNKDLAAQTSLLQNVDLTDRGEKDIDAIIAKSEDLLEQLLSSSGFSDTVISAKMQDVVAISVWDGSKYIKKFVPRDAVNLMSLAESELEESGLISSDKEKGIGFSTYDVTSQQLASIVNGPQYEQMAKDLEALGYKLDEQTEIAVTSEGSLNSYTKDWKIVQYLLQQILETEKDQLEGFYNFPADMFPYIPVTPGMLSLMQNGGGGVGGIIPEPENTRVPAGVRGEQKGPAGRIPIVDLIDTIDQTVKSATAQVNNVSDKLDWINKPRPIPLYEGSSMNQYRTPLEPEKEIIGESAGEIKPLQDTLTLDTAPLTAAIGAAMLNFSQTVLKNLSTRLALNINNRMVLQVSGRVLAEIVRPYLKDELIRYSNTGGSSVSVNVV